MPGYYARDSWFALTEDAKVAEVEGFKILLALARPLTETPEGQNPYQRRPSNPRERIVYFYTKDGVHYHVGGFLFDTPVFADIHEWSGSTILRSDGRLQTFYTIAGDLTVNGVYKTGQRFAVAIQRLSVEGRVRTR